MKKYTEVKIVIGLENLLSYVENSFIGHPSHIKILTIDEIKAEILKDANEREKEEIIPVSADDFQVQCLRDWDKCHVFEYIDDNDGILCVKYIGTVK